MPTWKLWSGVIAGMLALACSSDDDSGGNKKNGVTGAGGGGAESCETCVDESCEAEITTCQDNAECAALETCLDACTDDACSDKCLTDHAGGQAAHDATEQCVDQKCMPACAE